MASHLSRSLPVSPLQKTWLPLPLPLPPLLMRPPRLQPQPLLHLACLRLVRQQLQAKRCCLSSCPHLEE